MFVATRPRSAAIDRFLMDSRTLPFSYQPTGLTQGAATGYKVDEMVVPVQGRKHEDGLPIVLRFALRARGPSRIVQVVPVGMLPRLVHARGG